MAGFTTLRKISMHPLLVRHLYDDETVKEIAGIAHRMSIFGGAPTVDKVEAEILQNYSDFSISEDLCRRHDRLRRFCLPEGSVLVGSAKLTELLRLVDECGARGSRPLVFSQWTQSLDMIEAALRIRGVSYYRLDGSTTVSDRQSLVDSFNRDTTIKAFLLTTKSGGVGLNLTGADTVIMYDGSFNPHDDKQSEDRAHRLGQTKDVTVYRLVAKGSVDESICAIAERKLALEEALMAGRAVDPRLLKATEKEHMKELMLAILGSGSG